ncbi:MAG: 3-isopropylmalate dehydratase small subunit [Caldilineae bacterium]|nr:MAG: 3-isopropylmalate dehydratase small subunit [Caldilineae bacterium]
MTRSEASPTPPRSASATLIAGRVLCVGDDVNTDLIIPGPYCLQTDPAALGPHCLEGIRPGFVSGVQPGDVLVAGENFGGGSSREHAVLALMGAGFAAVIAASFARIFFRNAINLGLPAVTCPQAVAVARNGDVCRINLNQGTVEMRGRTFQAQPFPPFILEILQRGGLMSWVAARIEQRSER